MDWHLVCLFSYIEEFPTVGCLDIWENMGFPVRGYGNMHYLTMADPSALVLVYTVIITQLDARASHAGPATS